MSNKIAVLYLLRNQPNIDIDFFNFYSNYKNYRAGVKHQLVVILKGWNKNNKIIYKIKILLTKFSPIYLNVDNENYDIGSYIKSEHQLNDKFKYLFFLNTYSFPQQHNWLKKHYITLINNSLQITGSSGSYDSWKFVKPPLNSLYDLITFPLRVLIRLKNHLSLFSTHNKKKSFHFRTNGFLIYRDLFKRYFNKKKLPKSKKDTYQIEVGINSLSNFLSRNDNKFFIVGRNKIFTKKDLINEGIFDINLNSEIIISDNYTRMLFKN
jgi:hypothetical protein